MERFSEEPMNKTWHYQPDTPIPVSPILDWPPKPIAWLRWISRYWIAVSSVVMELVIAFAIIAYFHPSVEEMQSLHWTWIGQIWLRNLLLITLVAGGLHLWFYTLSGQGKKLKFEAREFIKDRPTFTFRDQVKDNMFWTLASGVTFWTAYEVLYFWAAANGYAPGLVFLENPVWYVAWLVLIPIWASFHFYWAHRLLHWPPLFKLAHSLHHRNVNIGPWSGISMHPVEHLLYFSSLLIHFVVPSSAVHVVFHFYNLSLNPSFSHSGFESVVAGDKRRLNAGDFFHQLHHKYFECNYGTSEMPWDVVFSSFHNGTEEATKATRERLKKSRVG